MFPRVTRYALRARYVLPIDGPPLADGVVHVEDGLISRVSAGPPARGQKFYDLGNVALFPGLVNAHIHLDFSDLAAPLGHPRIPFPQWLETVIRRRRGEAVVDAAASRAAVAAGLRQSLEHGTTTLGNITQAGEPAKKAVSGVDCIAFLETIGLSAQRAEAERERMLRWLSDMAPDEVGSGGRWRAGISPHAPYTARRELVTATSAASRKFHVPVAMHLAESREELQLLDSQDGPLVDVLASFDTWHPDAFEQGLRPLDYLKLLGDAERALVIHGNYLDAAEHAWLAKHADRVAVVYCPRTHHYFGHAPYPLAELIAAGATVALGTDGRGTNPDLSLLAEMRHIARTHSEIAPHVILRLGTLGGAQALGCAERVGSLKPGKDANLVAVRLPDQVQTDPHELLLTADTDVMLTTYRGRLVHPRAQSVHELDGSL